MASSSLAQGFGSLTTQQQAKSMSQQYLNSNAGGKPTVYNSDVTAIKDLASFMSNQTNTRQDQVYQRQLQDGRDWAERSAQIAEGTQRRNLTAQQNIAAIQGSAQVSSATASAAPGLYNAQSSRIGAIGQVSRAGGTEFAKSLIDPYYRPNIQRIDEEAFNERAEANADKAFGRNSSGGGGGSSGGGGGSSSSGSVGFGMNAPTPSGYSMNYNGTRGLYDASEVANFNSRQSNTARNNAMFSRANAAGEIAVGRANVGNQKHLIAAQSLADAGRSAREFDYQQKVTEQQQQFQGRESAAERASRERTAAIQAESNVYSSMFNLFRSSPGDYQYWGGKV